MSVSVEWGNPQKSIIIITRTEPWTWEEFRASGSEIVTMLNNATHNVDIIDNLNHNSFMPPTGFAENMRWAMETYRNHAHVHTIIDVIGSMDCNLFRSIYDLYGSSGPPYFCVRSLEQAYTILSDQSSRKCR